LTSDWQISLTRADPFAPTLLLLTHLYNHYLLLTPDDEFFSPENGANPFTLDEVLEIAGIWRDLAYWGYMGGVASGTSSQKGVGTEEVRGMFTRGVTRVAERK
jgi:ubiquitin-protein ligase E3 C